MAHGIPNRTASGLDLRLRRVAAGFSQTEVATAMGVSRRRVGNLEAMIGPPRPAIERYPRCASLLYGRSGVGKGVVLSWDIVQLTNANERVLLIDYGPLWKIASTVRTLADEFAASIMVVDSLAPACLGMGMNDPATPQQYGSALAIIGRPSISIGQANRASDLSSPYGSGHWVYYCRAAW